MNRSPKRFIKVLESNGWVLNRIKGSHHILYHPILGKSVSVPVHGNKDIDKGLFFSLIKNAELNIKDF